MAPSCRLPCLRSAAYSLLTFLAVARAWDVVNRIGRGFGEGQPIPTAAESFLGPDHVLDGVVTGQGNLRVAGRLKGNVDIEGELTIEPGALVEGEMKARRITVASGARMRGTMEFGWSSGAAR